MDSAAEKRIKSLVQARKLAEDVSDLIRTESGDWGNYVDDCLEAFWSRLRECIDIPDPPAPDIALSERAARLSEPMGDAEAAHFGRNQEMPFGKHAGRIVDSVPLDYLVWLADQPSAMSFTTELRRYLKSERIQREIESASPS